MKANVASRNDLRALPRQWSLGIVAAGIAVLYFGSTVPTPLYPLYRSEWGISEFAVTGIYAIYVIGNLGVLFLFGRLSDQIGRRRSAIVALGANLVSSACFLIAAGAGWLLAARVLNGFAAGLGAGALTAWFAELEPDRARAASAAAAANLAGLAAGAVVAGALAEHAPWPLRTSWALHLALIATTIVLLHRVPDTVLEPARRLKDVSLRPRIGVPRGLRLAFAAPAATAFTAFALGGFYAALVPGMLGHALHVSNVLIVGGVVALFFAVAAIMAIASLNWRSRSAVVGALSLYLPALVLLVAAERERSMPLLILATVIAGAAMALGYRGSLQTVNELAPEERRAEVLSSYLIACYMGNSLPVIGVGLLALAISPAGAHAVFAAVLIALAVSALLVEWKLRKH